MSRRLVIGILVVLIVGILGGTVAFIVQRLQGEEGTGAPETTTTPEGLTIAREGQPTIVEPNADTDGDGLTNAEESVWGTDPNNGDSDGDTYRDGEEVLANHNPTIPSPNDKLPEGFNPGQNLRPLDLAPIQVDQFFADNLNLDAPTPNYTAEYNSRYPVEQRTQETLVAFVQEKPTITQLPSVKDEAIITAQADSPLTIGHYLDTANNLETLMNPETMSEIFADLFENNDASSAYGMAVQVRLYQNELKSVPVPPAAVSLHKLLLGFTELLVYTYTQMATYNGDPVKAMAAINQLDGLDRKYMPLFQQEIARLEALAQQ